MDPETSNLWHKIAKHGLSAEARTEAHDQAWDSTRGKILEEIIEFYSVNQTFEITKIQSPHNQMKSDLKCLISEYSSVKYELNCLANKIGKLKQKISDDKQKAIEQAYEMKYLADSKKQDDEVYHKVKLPSQDTMNTSVTAQCKQLWSDLCSRYPDSTKREVFASMIKAYSDVPSVKDLSIADEIDKWDADEQKAKTKHKKQVFKEYKGEFDEK
jgi:hypothetical protein